MKFCTEHWERLRRAIDDRGLTRFVSQSDADLIRKHSTGASPATRYDPLLEAHNAIVANTFAVAGLELFETRADGSEWCPICFLLTCQCGRPECPTEFEGWIENAANDALEAAHTLKLIGSS